MGDPVFFIFGLIALATVLLWPIRAWIASRRNRDEEPGETPLAPPPRRNKG